jgi:winged helix DNA-binding protein
VTPKRSPSNSKGKAIGPKHVARFRVERHHLGGDQPDAVTVSRDVCGLQAQIMSAAYLQAWTRNHAITRGEIEDALWKKRTLIKTSLMRQTVHVIPADEFPIYISALKSSRVAGALRIMRRCGIGDEEAAALTSLIMDILSPGPRNRGDIHAAVRPKVSKRVRAWMDKVWSIVRIPIAEGLICYGPGEGNQATFIRTDQWMAAMPSAISEEQARARLFRCYLRAYGPATVKDFAHWAGMPAGEVRPLPALLAPELEEIAVEKKSCLLLRADLDFLGAREGGESSVRLLPHFDPYLLAHREKDHLIASRHYKRVYRNQGWISPVVLVDGAVAGVWRYKLQGKQVVVTVEAFDKMPSVVKARIARESESLAGFLGGTLGACRIVSG